MKNVNNFQKAIVQPGVAYKSVTYKKCLNQLRLEFQTG